MSMQIGKARKGKISMPLKQYDSGILSDYVTAVSWSPNGKIIAISSAGGEVILWQGKNKWVTLQAATGLSVDCLSFSRDSQLLAAGGQDGIVKIWRLPSQELIATLDNSPAWVDRLAWSFTDNHLAFSISRYVQIWDGDSNTVIATLNFEASSVLSMAWHPVVANLALGGYQGVKIWHGDNWDDDPDILEVPSACQTLAWSPNGKYLACGNIDRTLAVFELGKDYPWLMQGFPGKIRALAWSSKATLLGTPLLASGSAEGIVVWEKQIQEGLGWESLVLEGHEEVATAIAFQPNTFLLASASADGRICLWQSAEELVQTLGGVSQGFSCIAWQPQGKLLAAGGDNGELLVLSTPAYQASIPKGFQSS